MEGTGMSDMQFNALKMIVSDWYDENGCLTMLKVLFRDMVANIKLAKITNTIDLLNELVILGKMSAKDATLLHDTIRITGHFALQKKIKETLPLFPDIEEGIINSFTSHRQKLLKLGNKLTTGNVTQIDKLYNTPRKMYTDSWSMITDLEDKQEIREENMSVFINSLKFLKLHLALKALTEVDNGEALTSKRPKSYKGFCGPADGMGESSMSSHQQQPSPARQLLSPQQLQQLSMQSLQKSSQGNEEPSTSKRPVLNEVDNGEASTLKRPKLDKGYWGIGGSAMSNHQQQPPPARQLLDLHQQLQQLQAQDAYNYLAWNQPVPDSLRSAVQDEIIKDYLTRKQKVLYQDVNRMTPAIWHKHHEVNIAEVFTELNLLKSGKEERAQNKSTCIRKEGKPTSLTEVLHIIKSTGSCKVLITGKGGMGKTTLLKYIAYKWATGTDDVHNIFAGKLLFVIKIGDIKAGTNILEIILKNINTQELIFKKNLPFNSVERFLYNHDDDIVILLDGYDELQSDAKNPIYLFKGLELEKSTVVITSRPDNTIDLVKCCTVHIEVNGFSPRNIKEYIHNHFRSINKCELGTLLMEEFRFDEEYEVFWGGVHKEAFELCSSPLLLLMICTIWEQKQHLPKDLSDLFIELICCILNQYESKSNDEAAIFQMESIPEQYTLAILLLGECMYEGLKENKLSIDKDILSKMTKNVPSVALATKLGFVYEDSPINPLDVRKIYTPPHKLISEALAGFFLANQIKNDHLKDDEYERIRSNKYLIMTRVFTIGFLGVKAGKLLKHWVVRPSNLHSIAQCFKYVKEENEKLVLQDLDNMMSTEMKSYCEQMCETFKSVLDDDRSEHLLKLMKKCCVKYKDNEGLLEQKVISLVDTSSKESLRKSCRAVSLMSVIVQIIHDGSAIFKSHNHLNRCISNWDDESLNVLSAEMKYIQTNYDYSFVVLNWGFNSSFLIHLLTHSDLLRVHINGVLTEDILSVVIKELHKTSVKLTLNVLDINYAHLHNINGVLLGKLFGIAPELHYLDVSSCSLSGHIVRAMMTECQNNGGKLFRFNINNNDFNDDALLCDILKVFPNLRYLQVASCGLSNESFHNIVNELPKSELLYLDFSKNYLGNLDGETFGTLMKKLPKLVSFNISHCSLSGSFVNEMMVECGRMNVVLKANFLKLKGNGLSDIDGKSLAELVRVIRHPNATADADDDDDYDDDDFFCDQCFKWSDYFLTSDNLQNLIESVGVNETLNWKKVDLSNINLSSISGEALACLFKISPDLTNIDLSYCSLSSNTVIEMMEECGRINVVLTDNMLTLKGNDLSDINAITCLS